MAHRTIFPLLGEGGGGSTAWGQITGNLNNQTDLKNALDLKVDISGLATVATSGDYDDLTNKPTIPAAQIQSDWDQSDNTQVDFIKNKPTLGTMAAESASNYTPTSGLATVATTGSYPDLHNRPTIPTVNNATITLQDDGGTTIDTFTLNQSSNKTITIPSGGGNTWYGSMEELEAIPQNEIDPDTDYFVYDKIDYTEITNTPVIPSRNSQLENDSNYMDNISVYKEIRKAVDYMENKDIWLTKAEYDALQLAGKLEEGKNYHIEHNVDTVQMEVTFTDQTTATYNVYIQPAN